MPNKYPDKKGWKVPKQKFKVTNWSDYNEALRRRGDITVWLSDDAISHWYKTDRVYDGTGAPKLYTDFAIITCHELRLVYKIPLRQCQSRRCWDKLRVQSITFLVMAPMMKRQFMMP